MKTLTILLALVVLSPLASAQSADQFRPFIERWEGYRHVPYYRAGGERSVGIGHNTAHDMGALYYTDADIQRAYVHDYAVALSACRADVPGFDGLPPDVKRVCLSLVWTCGPWGFHQFRAFRMALDNREYGWAAGELKRSRWAHQVSPARLRDHIARLNGCMKTLDK